MVYYKLVVFKNKTHNGETLPNQYKRLSNAENKFESLVKSRLYEVVILRREDVYRRTLTCEISTSSPIKKWETA